MTGPAPDVPDRMRSVSRVDHRVLAAGVVLALVIHVALLALSRTVLLEWRWVNQPVHSVMEAMGSFIALFIAPLLLSLERRGDGTSFNRRIAVALIVMGTLDGLHALAHAGNAFVFLHSAATFGGGLMLSFVWLPGRWVRRWARVPMWAPFSACLLLGAGVFLWPALVPQMVDDGQFTVAAKALNVAGGLLLFAAAARLALAWKRARNTDDLLFVAHAILFGAAAIMFEESRLWDAAWWGWHVLRLLAFTVALWYVVESLRYDEELALRADALLDANAELERYAHAASHDMQEPLRSIEGFSALLAEEYADRLDDRGLQWLGFLTTSARQMSALVRDQLEYARTNAVDRPHGPVDLNAVMASAMEFLEAAVSERAATVTVDELPTVHGDPGQLRQLFVNFVTNALKYSDGPPVVHVEAARGADEWVVSFIDEGIGIPIESREQVFVMFKRLVRRSRVPGTGLGLAMCRRVAERHGGRVWVDANPRGKGSRFRVTFPVSRG